MRALLALACCLFAAAAAGAQDGLAPLGMEEIAPGVYVHTGRVELAGPENEGDIANLGFVVGGESVAVIDTGNSLPVGEALLAAVRSVTALPVRYVINTHMHPDHVLGNAAFRTGGTDGAAPTVIGHAKLPEALAVRAEHYLASARRDLGEAAAGLEIVLPTQTVAEETRLDLGGRTLLLHAWPTAHTNNDLTVLDETTGTLFAGDLAFLDHIPALDGSLLGWLGVMDALAALPASRAVPGHGPASAPWPDALEPQRAYLEALAAEVRAKIAAGETLSEAVEESEAPQGWRLGDDFHRRNVTTAFAQLEWE